VQQELLIIEAGAQQEIEETGEEWRHWVQLLRELEQKGVCNRLIISVLMMLSENFTGYVNKLSIFPLCYISF
jgi:hypothetical protein